MTISGLSSEMKMNRNLVAKYLDILLISGQVEMQVFGAARVYFLSRRVPISAILEFSSDLVIIVDGNQRILQMNENVPALLGVSRDTLMGNHLDELDHPFTRALHTSGSARDLHSAGELVTDISCSLGDEERYFRVKQVPTAFEDGSDGFTYIIEEVTARKKFEERLKISEARYRGLVQSSGEAIIGNGSDGFINSWNPAAERLYGYKDIEVLGKPIQILVPAGDREDFGSVLNRIGQGDTVHRCEIKMVRKDDSLVDVMLTISPIIGENGAILGASSIARDITSEKMEQCLKDHEDQYRTLVEDLNVGIYRSTGDPRGRFVWGNTALLKILGYHSISDLQGVNVIDVFSKPDGRLELLDELRNNRFVKNRVLQLKKPDGSQITVSVTALAEFDDNGDLVFINGIVQDITGFSNSAAFRPEL
jgi:PAS domain S-box-containing protein